MRIIGGTLGGTIIRPPLKSWPTRPTTDIAREALYNILMNRIDFSEVSMLDLFGGTGAHSFEFLSRGCRDVTYVDSHYGCTKWVKTQIDKFDFNDQCHVVKMKVTQYLKRCTRKFDFIFADPPYALRMITELPGQILKHDILMENGIIVIEHSQNIDFSSHSHFSEERNYGQSKFTFFSFN